MSANWSSRTSTAPAEERSQDAERVINAAAGVTGEENGAVLWFRNEPLSPFGSKTAEQLVCEGRTDDVMRFLESLETGAAG